MAYIQPKTGRGYTPFLKAEEWPEVGMDVGLLILEEGDIHEDCRSGKETAVLLLEGEAELRWNAQKAFISRSDPFHEEGSCLHLPAGMPFSVRADSHCELYIQGVVNSGAFPPRLFKPGDIQVQHAGARGELGGMMHRVIRTVFDDQTAPWSGMVLGEVLNYPGKWSSYPPHHHPQPEVYFHRFDRPNGFGASFANGEAYVSRHNGLTVILDGFHSQAAAPGYAMVYVWGIRHLPGNPWLRTRIDDPGHEWLWKGDANQHIFQAEEER